MGIGIAMGDRRIAERVHTLWRASGVPQSALGKAAGLAAKQLSERLTGKARFTPHQLLKVLEALAIDPGEFVGGVRGGFHAEHYLAGIALRHERQVKTARSDRLRGSPSKPYTDGELRRVAEGLEELRFVDPKAAKKRAFDVLRTADERRIDAADLFEARLTLAAVDRTRGRYGATAFSLLEALRLAGPRGRLKARVLQAVLSLATDLGDFDEAHAAVRQARDEFRLLDDQQGVGRTWVSEGVLRLHQGDAERALDAYRQALPFVASDRWIDRYAALHGLCFCHIFQGDTKEALAVAGELFTLTKSAGVPVLKRADALWLRAELRLKTDSWIEGVADLRRVLVIYLSNEASPGTAALASLRLAYAYRDFGDLEQSRELAQSMAPLLNRVAHINKGLAGSVKELVALAARKDLPLEVLERIYREILAEAAHGAPTAAHLALR